MYIATHTNFISIDAPSRSFQMSGLLYVPAPKLCMNPAIIATFPARHNIFTFTSLDELLTPIKLVTTMSFTGDKLYDKVAVPERVIRT
jgi:hypothetical protein